MAEAQEEPSTFSFKTIQSHQEARQLMERFLEVARPQNVFSQPVSLGEYHLITASEVTAGIGFGLGGGGGQSSAEEGGFGSGGGGGGTALARPVAAIEIGPYGVRVEPVVDVTKIVLAFLTAFGSMFFMLRRMRQASK